MLPSAHAYPYFFSLAVSGGPQYDCIIGSSDVEHEPHDPMQPRNNVHDLTVADLHEAVRLAAKASGLHRGKHPQLGVSELEDYRVPKLHGKEAQYYDVGRLIAVAFCHDASSNRMTPGCETIALTTSLVQMSSRSAARNASEEVCMPHYSLKRRVLVTWNSRQMGYRQYSFSMATI